MANFASITIMGNLGKEPEMRSLPDGTQVVNFSLASTRKRRDQETTTWWRCACFGKQAEIIAQYMTKGSGIIVQGEPSAREYQTQDGTTKTSLEIDVKTFSFLPKTSGQTGQASQPKSKVDYQAPANKENDFDDDIPF